MVFNVNQSCVILRFKYGLLSFLTWVYVICHLFGIACFIRDSSDSQFHLMINLPSTTFCEIIPALSIISLKIVSHALSNMNILHVSICVNGSLTQLFIKQA